MIERTDLATDAELAAAATIRAGSAPGARSAQRRRADDAVAVLLDSARRSLDAVAGDAHRTRRRTGIDLDDLRQEAALAALAAARTWDPQRHPSWTAYAAAAAKHAIAATLDCDEGGRNITRAAARLMRHARGVRASAETRGERLGLDELLERVAAVSAMRAEERGVDPEVAMRRSGEFAALEKDLPWLLAEGNAVRLDAPLSADTDAGTWGDVVVAAPEGDDPLAELLTLGVLDPDDVATAADGDGVRAAAAANRICSAMSAPHLQWAVWGPDTL